MTDSEKIIAFANWMSENKPRSAPNEYHYEVIKLAEALKVAVDIISKHLYEDADWALADIAKMIEGEK